MELKKYTTMKTMNLIIGSTYYEGNFTHTFTPCVIYCSISKMAK
ncbi:hypothetical protein HMPREF9447_00757 [Bacteroides oleiciplenus YIT 12058]|uniref:Uncharacterized protein n=1 Tax=Bacteroides oleiciplenus YIT 12058 TaxID=742727 RepID=K9EMY5_9BACE|nr:hypothetical protein HMPREF9447_00757 [Bacteroides oleiciplenus YIT 12058]